MVIEIAVPTWEEEWQQHRQEDSGVDYIVRQLQGKQTKTSEGYSVYQVARFEEGCNEPTAVHEVTFTAGGVFDAQGSKIASEWSCNCPSCHYPNKNAVTDKHIQLVKAWLNADRPSGLGDDRALERWLQEMRRIESGIKLADWDDFQIEARDLLAYIARKDIDNIVAQLNVLNDMALKFVDTSLLPSVGSIRAAKKKPVDSLIDAVVPSSMSGVLGRWMIFKVIKWMVTNKFMTNSKGTGLLGRTPQSVVDRFYDTEKLIPPSTANLIWRLVQDHLIELGVSWDTVSDMLTEGGMTDADLIKIIYEAALDESALRAVVELQLNDFLKLHSRLVLEPATEAKRARSEILIAAVVAFKLRKSEQIHV